MLSAAHPDYRADRRRPPVEYPEVRTTPLPGLDFSPDGTWPGYWRRYRAADRSEILAAVSR